MTVPDMYSDFFPLFRYSDSMAKVKTTVYLDEDLLRAARVWAARKDLRDSEVLEQALRKFLGRDVLDDIWARNASVDEATANAVAYDELSKHRAGS